MGGGRIATRPRQSFTGWPTFQDCCDNDMANRTQYTRAHPDTHCHPPTRKSWAPLSGPVASGSLYPLARQAKGFARDSLPRLCRPEASTKAAPPTPPRECQLLRLLGNLPARLQGHLLVPLQSVFQLLGEEAFLSNLSGEGGHPSEVRTALLPQPREAEGAGLTLDRAVSRILSPVVDMATV